MIFMRFGGLDYSARHLQVQLLTKRFTSRHLAIAGRGIHFISSLKRRAPLGGSAVVWPAGLEERYGISSPTRWRWEKSGRLPPRDVNIGGKTGWRPETLAAAEHASPSAS